MNLKFENTSGQIKLAKKGITADRLGTTDQVRVKTSEKDFEHAFEIMELNGKNLNLGMDIIAKLGLKLLLSSLISIKKLSTILIQ